MKTLTPKETIKLIELISEFGLTNREFCLKFGIEDMNIIYNGTHQFSEDDLDDLYEYFDFEFYGV